MRGVLILVLLAITACNAVPRKFLRPNAALRIIGGDKIDIREVPYQVALKDETGISCGGAILNSRFILTAAYCVSLVKPILRVGMGSSDSENFPINVPLFAVYIHEKFNYTSANYNFAIIELEKDIPFDDTMQPISLPNRDLDLKDGTMLKVAGWGMHDQDDDDTMRRFLRAVSVPKVNEEECRKNWEDNVDMDHNICAGYKEGGKDACLYDFGSPLVMNGTLVGVYSGSYCGRPNIPGIYGRVSTVLDWVNQIINKL